MYRKNKGQKKGCCCVLHKCGHLRGMTPAFAPKCLYVAAQDFFIGFTSFSAFASQGCRFLLLCAAGALTNILFQSLNTSPPLLKCAADTSLLIFSHALLLHQKQ